MSSNSLRTAALRSAQVYRVARTMSTQVTPQISDEEAISKYLASSQSFKNIPIEKISFAPKLVEGKKNPEPSLVIAGRQKSGLLHVTPFTRVLFPKFGPNGNLGLPRGFAPGNQDDPKLAENEISLAIDGFPSHGQPNQLAAEYFDWLKAIEDKLIQHIADAHKEYPILKKRFGSLLEKDDVRHELIANAFSRSLRTPKPREGFPSNPFLSFRQKIYVRASPDRLKQAQTFTELDGKMLEQGFVRRRLPVLDAAGNDLGVEAVIKPGDVVSLQLLFDGSMYEVGSNVGFGLRKIMRNVILLRHREAFNKPNSGLPA